jgi:hypothetical protein
MINLLFHVSFNFLSLLKNEVGNPPQLQKKLVSNTRSSHVVFKKKCTTKTFEMGIFLKKTLRKKKI